MILFVIIFLFTKVSHAQPFLTLLNKILKQDETINSSKFLVKKAKNDLSSTTSLYTPKIDLTVPFGREILINNDATNTDLDYYEFNAKVTQNLFDFGLTSSKLEKARNKLKLAEVSEQNVKINKIYEALSAYLNYIKSYNILEFSKQSEARIKEVSNLENEKVARGAGLASNVLQSKAKLAGAKSTRVRFQGELEVAKNRFFNVFRVLPSNFNSFKAPNLPINLLPSSEEEAIKIAKNNNISLTLSLLNLENAKSSIKTSKSKFFPSLKASAEYKNKRNMSGLDGTEIDHIYKLEMKYPISIGGPYGLFFKENSEYKSSMNQYMIAKYSYDQMERNLEETVRNAWQTKKSSKENYEYLQNQANISGEFFDIAMKEVKLGNRQLIDILSSETAFINSKSAAEVANTNYQLATYQLLLSIGTLDDSIFRKEQTLKQNSEKTKKIKKSKNVKKEQSKKNKNTQRMGSKTNNITNNIKQEQKIKAIEINKKKPQIKTSTSKNFEYSKLKTTKKDKEALMNERNNRESNKISKKKDKEDKKLNKPIIIINENDFFLNENVVDNNHQKFKEVNDLRKITKLKSNKDQNNNYKIQLGAFSSKSNANNLLKEITTAQTNNIKLYIKQDKTNLYYKILSVDTYSRTNAMKICEQFTLIQYKCIILK